MMGTRLLLVLALAATPAFARAPLAAPPAFFADGRANPALLRAIAREVPGSIAFNRHYSLAMIACGTACVSYWFVDRRNGAVVAAPGRAAAGEMIWSVDARVDSDVVRVVFGPADGIGSACKGQSFRLVSPRTFRAVTPRRPMPCPA